MSSEKGNRMRMEEEGNWDGPSPSKETHVLIDRESTHKKTYNVQRHAISSDIILCSLSSPSFLQVFSSHKTINSALYLITKRESNEKDESNQERNDDQSHEQGCMLKQMIWMRIQMPDYERTQHTTLNDWVWQQYLIRTVVGSFHHHCCLFRSMGKHYHVVILMETSI